MNIVILTGRLTDDPELKYTQQGTACTSFNLAVNRPVKGDEADFPTIAAWREQAEAICKYLHKGSKVIVRGEIRTKTYDDRTTGKKRKATEVLLDRWEFAESKQQGPF